MINPFKLQEMMSQAGQMKQELEDKLTEIIVEGNAGAGAVSVKINGRKDLLELKLDPSTLAGLGGNADLEMLETLIKAAVNDAGRKADEAIKGVMGGTLGKMMGGLGLPNS